MSAYGACSLACRDIGRSLERGAFWGFWGLVVAHSALSMGIVALCRAFGSRDGPSSTFRQRSGRERVSFGTGGHLGDASESLFVSRKGVRLSFGMASSGQSASDCDGRTGVGGVVRAFPWSFIGLTHLLSTAEMGDGGGV